MVYRLSRRNLIFTFMKSIVTFFFFQFLTFALIAQAEPSQRKESVISKYNLEVNRDTKNRITTDSEIDEMAQKSAFNFHYSVFLKSELGNKNYPALIQAYQLDSTNSELFFELAKYNEIIGNEKSKREFCKKLQSEKLSSALREYAYNTLMSVETNGILITYGEKDTYPIWILQTMENLRTDVKVLNYDLLVNSSYRNRIQKELGIRFSKRYAQNIDILKEVAEKNPSKPIYYSLTVSHLVMKELKTNLYPTGLALKYSKTSFDNLLVLKTNWESKFKKNHLVTAENMESDRKMNLNYVLPLLQLSNYYKDNNMTLQQERINHTILLLGKSANKYNQVKSLLNK